MIRLKKPSNKQGTLANPSTVQGVMQEHLSRLEETAKTVHPLHQVAHQYVMQIEIADMLHCATVMLFQDNGSKVPKVRLVMMCAKQSERFATLECNPA